jgi:hypothetical protein
LGVEPSEIADGFAGSVDETKLWDRVLSSSEIENSMSSHSPKLFNISETVLPTTTVSESLVHLTSGLKNTDGLLLYYTYDELNGVDVIDHGDNNLVASLTDLNIRTASGVPLNQGVKSSAVGTVLIIPLKATPVAIDGVFREVSYTLTKLPLASTNVVYEAVLTNDSKITRGNVISAVPKIISTPYLIVIMMESSRDELWYSTRYLDVSGANVQVVSLIASYPIALIQAIDAGVSVVVIIAVAGGSLVGVAAIVAGVGVYFLKKQQKAITVPEVPPPDFTPTDAWAEYYWEVDYDAAYVASMSKVNEMLTNPLVALGICKSIQITEADELTKALVFALEPRLLNVEAIKCFITDEVESSPRPQTLFRGNSFASKMMKSYAMTVGATYLHSTLSHVVNEYVFITDHNKSEEVEVDDTKGQSDTSVNKYALLQIAQRILNTLLKAVYTCPEELRSLCRHIVMEVEKKGWVEHIDKSVGGFIFLRFFAPALVAPHAFGLTIAPPSPRSQRMLTLVAKLLQNAANDVEFGKKEAYMMKMNDFISTNREKVMSYFKELASDTPSTCEKTKCGEELMPKGVLELSLIQIHRHMHMNANKMYKIFQEGSLNVGGKKITGDEARKIWITMQNIGPAPPGPKKPASELKDDASRKHVGKLASKLSRKSTIVTKAFMTTNTGGETELDEMDNR